MSEETFEKYKRYAFLDLGINLLYVMGHSDPISVRTDEDLRWNGHILKWDGEPILFTDLVSSHPIAIARGYEAVFKFEEIAGTTTSRHLDLELLL